jgi:hypothetical protein
MARDHYRKSPGEDLGVLFALRMTQSMDHSLDKYLQGPGKALYDSKAAFIRDAIYQHLTLQQNTNTASTVIGGLRLLNIAANDELLEQETVNTLANIEKSLAFYIANNAPDKIYELICKYKDIIANIDDKFWKNYLSNMMQNSQTVNQAISIAQAGGYVI